MFNLDYFDKEVNNKNNWYAYDDNVKHIYFDIVTNHMDVFTDTKKFRQLLTYCIYKNNHYNQIIVKINFRLVSYW